MLGVDVSGYQKKVDWSQLKRDGVAFAHTKATEGDSYIDPSYATNLVGAHAAGIPIGPYHFGRPDHNPGVSGARAEADFFCHTIGRTWTLRPVLDLETGSGDLTLWAGAFLAEVERQTYIRPLLYSYSAFFASHLNLKVLAGYPLWVADYGANDGKDHGVSLKNVEHQFTSMGVLSGVIGHVDENSAPSLVPLLRKVAPAPKPKPLWPIPVPAWFWTWAQWRRDGQSYERPHDAPTLIPAWAWVRLARL